jgi:hypothetical protein
MPCGEVSMRAQCLQDMALAVLEFGHYIHKGCLEFVTCPFLELGKDMFAWVDYSKQIYYGTARKTQGQEMPEELIGWRKRVPQNEDRSGGGEFLRRALPNGGHRLCITGFVPGGWYDQGLSWQGRATMLKFRQVRRNLEGSLVVVEVEDDRTLLDRSVLGDGIRDDSATIGSLRPVKRTVQLQYWYAN